MDLSTLEVLPSIKVTVLDMTFTLAGPDHPKTVEARRKARAAFAAAEQEGEDTSDASNIGLAGRILDWKNVVEEGKPLPCSEENALKLLRHPKAKLIIPNALWAALGDTERFFKA